MTNILSQNETAAGREQRGAARQARLRRAGLVSGFAQLAMSPTAWICAFVVAAALALMSPLLLPVGSYYWDTVLYPDAAWRIASGQYPNVDFFTPAGPLEYYGFAALQRLFPNGHIVLLANWSVQIVALPLMACTIYWTGQADRRLALFLLLPFLVYSAFPLNTTQVHPMAGVDAFGFYNRHAALLLYVLVTTILFVREARAQIFLIAGLMLALFFTKITGFAVGLGLIAHGLLAGRIAPIILWFAAIATAAGFLAIDLPTGIGTAYLENIGALISMNQSGLLASMRKPVIGNPAIILSVLLLAAFLIWNARSDGARLLARENGQGILPGMLQELWQRINIAANREGVWLVSVLVATIVFESQNTGSLEFIMLWPLAIAILYYRWPLTDRSGIIIAALAAMALLPMLSTYANRALRAAAVSATYHPLHAPELNLLARVRGKDEVLARAKAMNLHYAGAKPAYGKLVANGHDQSYLLYSEPDFQIAWMMSVHDAVIALRAHEARHRLRFDRLLALDFADPFPAILGRTPVLHLSIGRMEGRTIPPLTGERLKAAHRTDAILSPRCPMTKSRAHLLKMFNPVLKGRTKVALTPCWDMYVKAPLARTVAR